MNIDILTAQLERINVLAEILYDILRDNPRAQVLAEVIVEASSQTKQ